MSIYRLSCFVILFTSIGYVEDRGPAFASEHLDERRLMVQWWAGYLEENTHNYITPYDFAKINYFLSASEGE